MVSLSRVLGMLSLGGAEVWIIILAIVVLIWGPAKLPGLAKGMGQAIKEFKKASKEPEEAPKPAIDQKKPAEAEKAGTTGHESN